MPEKWWRVTETQLGQSTITGCSVEEDVDLTRPQTRSLCQTGAQPRGVGAGGEEQDQPGTCGLPNPLAPVRGELPATGGRS